MSHRPVILKLPFNIPAASMVTRKEVRGHTMIVWRRLPACSALRLHVAEDRARDETVESLIIGGSKVLRGEFFRGSNTNLDVPGAR